METLMAVGTLAIGLLFIGGTFMTGVYLSTVSTERTMASVIADEAFAKIELYGLDPNSPVLRNAPGFISYDQVKTMPVAEFRYPSTWVSATPGRQYSWSAICKRVSTNVPTADHPAGPSRLVQFTVFVCRQTGGQLKYWVRPADGASRLDPCDLPRPVRVTIEQTAGTDPRTVRIRDAIGTDTIDEQTFISDGASIVDEATGQIYRVLERLAASPDTIALDRPWTGGAITPPTGGGVWVIPPGTMRTAPPASPSGRNPVVGIYQRTLGFDQQNAKSIHPD
jgi:hypothetical protein